MLPIALHFLNETLVGQTQANPYCLKFPKLEIVLCKNNFAWHFSYCYYSFLKLDPGTLPHLKEVFWDKSERFLVFFLFTAITKRSIFNVAGFLDPSLDCQSLLQLFVFLKRHCHVFWSSFGISQLQLPDQLNCYCARISTVKCCKYC